MFEHYKRILQNMSKAGISDSTISRLTKVSLTVIRKILLCPQYKPTARILETIKNNILEFRRSFE